MIEPTPLKDLSRTLQALVEGRLWLKVLIGLTLGVATGVALGPAAGILEAPTAQTVAAWLALPGNLFIRLVQMIMVPLIVSSVVQGIAGGDNREQLLRMGPRIGVYFLVTTAVSVVIGVALASLIQPGLLIDAAALGVERIGCVAVVLLVVTTVAASVGTPSSLGAGVVILATILTGVDVRPLRGWRCSSAWTTCSACAAPRRT